MTSLAALFQTTTMSELDGSRHLDALVEENRRQNLARYDVGQGCPVQDIGIIGAGYMGSIVAARAVRHRVPVVMIDRDPQTLSAARQSIQQAMKAMHDETLGNEGQELDQFVAVTDNLSQVAACDFVIETIVEDLNKKRELYADLEKLCRDDTVIASNTSTLPITELSIRLARPERFCGLHYFPPFGVRAMVEITPGKATSDSTASQLVQFSEHLGQIPVVVADGRGFVVNRVLLAYLSAGIRLLAAGVDIQAIDAAATSFGMRMGPMRLYDEIGLDVVLGCAWSLAADSDTLVAHSPTLVRMVKARQLGCKSGRGFFIHEAAGNERAGDVNPKVRQLLESQIETRLQLSPDQIAAAIVLPMVIEATKLLETGRARSARQVDLAIMCGFGFPGCRGGPLYWADQVGAERIAAVLRSLQHLGPHLCPTQLLRDAAAQRHRFYDLARGDQGGPAAAAPTARETADHGSRSS